MELAVTSRRIAILGERLLFLEGLSALCQRLGWTEAVSPEKPSVILMEASLGSPAVREWTLRDVPVAVILPHSLRSQVPELVEAGARAFIPENAPATHLSGALSTVAAGGCCVAPLPDRSREGDNALDSLSRRERQVFTGLVNGKRTKEIANELNLSPKTVDSYRSTLMNKLRIHDLPGLVRYAVRNNLLDEI